MERAKQELHSIQYADEHRAKLEEGYPQAGTKAKTLALALSEKRRRAEKSLVERVTAKLDFWGMPGVKLQVFHLICHLNAVGCYDFVFLLATYLRDTPMPAAKMASLIFPALLELKNSISSQPAAFK